MKALRIVNKVMESDNLPSYIKAGARAIAPDNLDQGRGDLDEEDYAAAKKIREGKK
jgi:hypothetical protein